jgi:GTP cyclohydrolase I
VASRTNIPRIVDREAAARAIDAFLKALGRNPERDPDLAETGRRVADAWADELLGGYDVDVDLLVEGNLLSGTSDVVLVRDIPVTTMCPHHLLPANGTATVAYAPSERLVGIGTIVAIVDAYARRLALQERIGEQVVARLGRHLAPRWAACKLVLEHGCMRARGERAHGSRVETIAFTGPQAERAAAHALLSSRGG